MGYGGYEAMERMERMEDGTTSENQTFKPISVTAAEAWVREVGLKKMPVPSVSMEDVKYAFVEGYELANSVREKESLLPQNELAALRVSGLGCLYHDDGEMQDATKVRYGYAPAGGTYPQVFRVRLIAVLLLALVTCGIGALVGLAVIRSELRRSWNPRA